MGKFNAFLPEEVNACQTSKHKARLPKLFTKARYFWPTYFCKKAVTA